MRKEYKSKLLQESFVRIQHVSGLTIYMYSSMKTIHTSAYLAINYGSVDNQILDNGKTVKLPDGTAHFMEHILFENSDQNTSLFSHTGAIANAYCTYNRTVYYFSCIDKFKENLKILVNAVLNPIFTSSLIDNVRNIIIQEIKLYQDNPVWIVDMNLLKSIYHSHPLTADISGTEESLKRIEKNLLYKIYNIAYNPHNMVLVVIGNFNEDDIKHVIDNSFNFNNNQSVIDFVQDNTEPQTLKNSNSIYKANGLSASLFEIGFKGIPIEGARGLYNSLLDELLVEMLIGEISPTYQNLYNSGIINTDLLHESACSRNYAFNKLSGESNKPYILLNNLIESIRNNQKLGFDHILFENCKKAMIGKYIYYYDDLSILANYMIISHFSGTDIYSLFDYIREINIEQIQKRLLEAFNPVKCAISIIEPLN